MRGEKRRLVTRPAVLTGLVVILAVVLGAAGFAAPARGQFWFGSRPMPDFVNQSPTAWINTAPLTKADLAGQVVLIEIWTSV
jgi:hypothetical protein